jgi:predicted PurR-regulated permease PerM
VQSVIIADLGTYAQRGLGIIVNNLGSIASSITGFFISLFIFYFGLYYLLKDGPAFAKYVVELSPLSDTDDKAILKKLERAVNSVIRGNLTIAFLQGIMSGIGYTIFGLPNSVLWGTATGFAALVPGVGTSLVMIPAVLYLLFSGSLWAGVGLLIWGMTAVGLIDNFLGPKLIGRGAKLHTFVVLLSVLGGLAFFGPAGLFLGPIAMSLLFALLSIYSNKRSAE